MDRIRSPFGELVVEYQQRLGLTQAELAQHATDTGIAMGIGAVSLRTIQSIERQVEHPLAWVKSYRATVQVLAAAFGLEPGTAPCKRFFDAAGARNLVAPETWLGAASPPLFVEAGRERHLARLRQHVAHAGLRQPGVVFVQGEAGAGKSALIQAVCREAVSARPGLVTLWARCPDSRETTRPHDVFGQILRSMIGDLGAASEEQRLSNLNIGWLAARAPEAARALIAHGPGLVDAVLSDSPFWSGKLARALDSDQGRPVDAALAAELAAVPGNSLCDQFFRVLTRYAADEPVMMVLEDLHRADHGTVVALSHLVRQLHVHRLPVLVIASLHPGEMVPSAEGGQLPTLMGDVARMFAHAIVDVSTSALEGRAFVRAMLDHAFEAVTPQATSTVFRLTAGLPLFVAGLVRSCPPGSKAGAAPAGMAFWLDRIPPEISAMIDAQLGRLQPAQRRILQAASVQGDVFSAELTMKMLEHAPVTWMRLVDDQLLRRHGLVVEGAQTSIGDRPVHHYHFANGLLREHVRRGMTGNQLTRLHLAAAEALIALHGERDHEATSDIAWHFDQAGELTRAVSAHLQAGIDAMIRQQYRRAIVHFDRIHQLPVGAVDDDTRIQSFIGLGNTMRGMGDVVEARRLLDQARVLAERSVLPLARAAALESMAMIDFDLGKMGAGVSRLAPAVTIYLEHQARDDAARAMVNLSYLRYGQGRYDDAIDLAERAGELARALPNDRTLVDASNARAICLIDLGQPEAAMTIYRDAIDLCDELGDHHRSWLCMLNISLAALEMEDWAEAHNAIHALLDAGGRSTRLVSSAEFNAGLIAEGMNDLQAARWHYERSRQIREGNGQVALLVDSLAGLLRVAVTEDDSRWAAILRAEMTRRIAERGVEGTEHCGRLFVTLIEAALAAGDMRGARAEATMGVAFLQARADRLADPENRRRYLAMAANRRVMELDALLDDWAVLHPTG